MQRPCKGESTRISYHISEVNNNDAAIFWVGDRLEVLCTFDLLIRHNFSHVPHIAPNLIGGT